MYHKIALIVIGLILDVVGFLIAFTSYFHVALPGWETGLALLVVGIIMDIVGIVL